MKTLKVLLLLCLVSCLEGWSKSYYVTTTGDGAHDGTSWSDAIGSDEFSKLFVSAPSGTTFLMASGKYYPGINLETEKAFIIEGGYTVVDGEGTRDLSTLTEDDMTILVGDVSSDLSKNHPVSIAPVGDDLIVSDISGVIFESSAVDAVFVMNNAGSGQEMVFKKGIARRAEPINCEGNEGKTYTAIIRVGEKTSFGVESIDNQLFESVGFFPIKNSVKDLYGCVVTDVYEVTVLPNPQVIGSKDNYYVKEKATGTGDGSSWTNAMGNDEFAFAFNKVKDGSTFHFAAGTYTPVYSYTFDGAEYACFWTDKCINLKGGYGKDPSDGDETDVINNKTIINSVAYTPTADGNISAEGINFTGTPAVFLQGGTNKVSLSLDGCSVYSSENGLFVSGANIDVQNCYFHTFGMGSTLFMVSPDSPMNVTSSTFEGIASFGTFGSASFTNCTFKQSSTLSSGEKSSLTLINNTSFITFAINGTSTATVIGNMFVNSTGIIALEGSEITSSNNIFGDAVEISWNSDADIIKDVSLFDAIFSKDEDGVFQLAYNGGLTPTVELLSDTLSDGTSLRFNRTDVTDVDVDQRGVARSENTCMGAYELKLTELTIKLKDTTVVAGPYVDLTYGGTTTLSVGQIVLRDVIKGGENQLDSIYVRNITVLPKSTDSNYFVTVKGTEAGDGSSWETAMSNDQFAFAVDKVENGATFHFGAGTYSPVYEKYDGELCFWTDKRVNLTGGYSENPSAGDLPNPSQNKTIFEGKIYSFVCEPVSDGTISISGVNFTTTEGVQDLAVTAMAFVMNVKSNKVSLLIDRCSFYDSNRGVSLTGVEETTIDKCHFYGNVFFASSAISVTDGGKITVSSSLFNGNFSSFTLSDTGKETVYFVNNTFMDNTLSVNSGNVTFVNNTISNEATHFAGGVVSLVGNLFTKSVSADEDCEISSSYNVFPQKTIVNWDMVGDIPVLDEQFGDILLYDADGKLVLADNGGFTPTAALLSDTLSNGTLIRFNRVGVTDVDVDQRGISRSVLTCMGAYELKLTERTINLKDTTVTAGAYTDLAYGGTKTLSVGEVALRDTVKGDVDIIYVRDITVLPKSTNHNYYVTVKGTEAGDGASWATAMSKDQFAFAFDKVEDGATFHMGAGTYSSSVSHYFNGNDNYCFFTEKLVNIVGGYEASPSEGDAPSPGSDETQTILEGEYYSLFYLPDSDGSIRVSGVDLRIHNEVGNGIYSALSLVGKDHKITLSVDSCSFYSSKFALYLSDVVADINQCNFHDFGTAAMLFYANNNAQMNINSSSFSDIANFGTIGSTSFTNCTFLHCNSIQSGSSASLTLINNTLFSAFDILSTSDATLIGNIFVNGINAQEDSKIISSNNIFPTTTEINWTSKDDKQSEWELLQSVFMLKDGEPVLAYNGGYTPTVALLADTLSDGTTLRFNHSGVTDVDVDQRGEARPDSTCMGAYEIGLSRIIINLEDDTIHACTYTDVAHGSGKSVEVSVGDYVWRDTVYSSVPNGLDTVYVRHLTILPNRDNTQENYHYYVKVNGSGDGSSWDKAMNNKAFAYSFDKVEDGATFHFAAGEYTPIYAAFEGKTCFWTDKCVNLVGGYPESPSRNEVARPGDPDTKVSFMNGDNYVVVCQPKSGKSIHVSGIDFFTKASYQSASPLIVDGGSNRLVLSVDKCSFMKGNLGLKTANVSATISDCYFYDNYNAMELSGDGCLYVYSSLFDNMVDCRYSGDSISFTNCTMTKGLQIGDFDYISMINNSILNSSSVSSKKASKIELVGNIIYGGLSMSDNGYEINSSHNLLSESDENSWVTESDRIDLPENIRAILAYDQENNSFALSDSGGYTMTVALLADTLPNGASIRFNRIGLTDVVVDQRGYARADSTCMGAYEFAITKKIIQLADTIVSPGDFVDPYGKELEDLPIGEIVLVDTVPGLKETDPDIIYIRKVVVLPDPYTDAQGNLHYYVKENGAGNGSSWKDAMNGDDFAFALDKVADNATFHIAEGVYHPVYPAPGFSDHDNVSAKSFFTSNSVNLIGGYSKNETSLTAVSSPDYHTVFEGSDEDVRTSLHVLSFLPNVEGKKLYCEGIEFKHANTYREQTGLAYASIASGLSSQCEFERCTFSDAECGLLTKNCAPTIRNCEFVTNNKTVAVLVDGTSSDTVAIESSYVAGIVSIADHFYKIVNSTLSDVRIQSASTVNNIRSGQIDNSTIGQFVAGADRTHVLRGNIIYSELSLIGNAFIQSHNNIYPKEDADAISVAQDNDRLYSLEQMLFFMDHDDNTFVAKNGNGGYTSTIALIFDTLPDGTSIRYKQTGKILNVDQRGAYRPEVACPGAYEFGCLPTSLTFDDGILESTATLRPGYHSDTTTFVDAGGCTHDTIHTYLVLPADRSEYYVKVVPEGRGDGSSWENAMDNNTFQLMLLHSKGEKTYYVAEGEYVALYDSLGNVPDSSEMRCFYTNKSVSIIGGFSSIATEGYKQNLNENPTIFTVGDEKSVHKLFLANVSGSEIISLNGITFRGSKKDAETKCEAISVNPERRTSGVKVNITNCSFEDAYKGLSLSYCSGRVSGCNFVNNSVCGLFVEGFQGIYPIYVDSSYFSGNTHGLNVSTGSDFYLTNSTFVDNRQSALYISQGQNAKYVMRYNTIMSGVYVDCGGSTLSWEGNIFGSKVEKNETFSTFLMTSSSNIYWDENKISEISESDMVLSKNDLYSLFDVDADGHFIETRGSGYTNCLPLRTDKLSNGESIRFERLSDNDVDQRGVSRMPMTSRGSYELLCKYDTIFAGQTLFGKLFESFGIYELNRMDTMGARLELVKHIIFVKPSLEPKDYYVKFYGEGTHSGSSWKNAMSREEFAWVFPMVPDHSTFHIAEGVYYPIYDMNHDSLLLDSRSKVYYTDHLVNIQGGYSHDVSEEDELPDPSRYFTVFSGYSNDGGDDLANNNFNILKIDAKLSGDLKIAGVTFEETSNLKGSGAIVVDAKNYDVTLRVEQCVVRNSYYGVVVDSCSLDVSECFFTGDSISIFSSGSHVGRLDVNSSTFTDGKVGIDCQAPSSDLSVSNSTFVDYSGNAISYASSSASNSCSLVNNSILSNLSISSVPSYECIGNIFSGRINILKSNDAAVNFVSSYNMYWNDPDNHNSDLFESYTTDSDFWVSFDALREILESSPSGSFTLKDNGGFAPTVAVIVDSLDGVGSIRFPKSYTPVKTDQRGINRKRNTCVGAYELDVYIPLDIPSAFTPYTLDGLNDVFMPDYEVYIYDRYGRLIIHSMDGWDGFIDGKLAEPGVYVYVLLDPDGDVRKGTIDILKAK